MFKCSYCRQTKLFENKRYFEGNLICKSCLKVVPGLQKEVIKALKNIF